MNSAIEFYIFEFVLGTKLQLKPTIWFLVPNLPKKCVSDPKQKSEHLHWILHVGISLGTKFQLKLTSLIFWTKFTPKWCFWSNAEKLNSAIDFCIFELVEVLNFSLNRQFWNFGAKFAQKVCFWSKTKKWTSPFNSTCVGISLGTKFQLKLTSLIFWTKFTPKWCFWSNAEKQNSAIDFCIFELVEALNFSLNRQFWFFGSSLLKKGISGYKRKNCTSSCFTYYIKLFRMGADR